MATPPETSRVTPAASTRRPWYETVAPWVFWPSAAIIAVFLLFAMAAPDFSKVVLEGAKDGISSWFGWYYTLIVSGFVVFSLWVGLGHFGDIKLGPDDEEPEFKLGSWLAMGNG
ncbi:MAG: BCCT family transporter [Micromonosporaceae bacterium]